LNSEIRHSQTSPVAIIGDTQRTMPVEFWRERNHRETGILFRRIAERNPVFLLHLGDITGFGGSGREWNSFDKHFHPMREKRIPAFPVLGNHEYYGNRARSLRSLRSRFPFLDEKGWYSFTHKRVGFIMLNSNLHRLNPGQVREQREWYRRSLAENERNREIDFVVVCTHHPPFTNGRYVRKRRRVREYFAEPFERSRKTALFLSGHCHSYERYEKGGKQFIISGGGGGPRHTLHTKRHKRSFPDSYTGPPKRSLHFCEMEIRDDHLLFRMMELRENDSLVTGEEFLIRRNGQSSGGDASPEPPLFLPSPS